MEVKISENLKQAFPKIKVGILEVGNVVNKRVDPRLEKEKRRLETFIRKNYGNVGDLEVIKNYNRFFRKFGKTYPIEFQIKPILKGKGFPSVSTVVEAMFMAELKNMFLTAGHDLDTLKDGLETRVTDGTEKYVKINLREQKMSLGDIVTVDGLEIISSVLYGPDFRTRITEKTRNCLFFSYFPYGEENINIKGHFQDIKENL